MFFFFIGEVGYNKDGRFSRGVWVSTCSRRYFFLLFRTLYLLILIAQTINRRVSKLRVYNEKVIIFQ